MADDKTTREIIPEMHDKVEERRILDSLREINFSVARLVDTMDTNLSLLEGSIREVRTAHEIAAESNRLYRRRLLRDVIPSVRAAPK